jgi:putative peptidoglycan lipid II flippase
VLVPVVQAFGWPGVTALAVGALFGGVMQILWQLPALRRAGVLVRPRFGLRDPAVRRSFVLMAPLLLGTGVYQLNILLSRLLASFLPPGSQSFLYYAQRLVEIPQGVFALAVASAALPSLARLRAQDRHDEALAALRHGLRLALFIALPAAVGLATLATPTVTVLFSRGVFDTTAVAPTARALVWLALGVWAVACVHPTVRMFYAYEQTRTPVACAALNLAVFFGVGVSLMGTMAHEGLALATSCAATAQLAALLVMLRRRLGPLGLRDLLRSALRSLVACVAMAAAARAVASLGAWERGGNDPRNVGVYAAAIVVAVIVYATVSRLLRSPELDGVVDALARRRAS